MGDNIVNNNYGYVENVDNEYLYQNMDYRDTTVPLWEELYNNLNINKSQQNQINIALCASVIQLGNNMTYKFNYLTDQLEKLEKKIDNLGNKFNRFNPVKNWNNDNTT